jgi:hypothetical protein
MAISYAHEHYSYVARGRYAEQLERWQTAFGAERLLILISEEFQADPAGVAMKGAGILGPASAGSNRRITAQHPTL